MTSPDYFSIDRVASYFEDNDYSYLTDNDGDLHINFEGNKFLVMSTGQIREILAIRGIWNKEVPADLRGVLFEFINDWHQKNLFPKLDLTVTEDGMLQIGAETNTDLEHGVTKEQLELLVDCGINSALNAFKELDNLELNIPDDQKRYFWHR